MIALGAMRQRLRALVLERRDCQADMAEARLRVIDAEAAGLDVAELQKHVAAMDARDAEMGYALRQLSAEIAAAEAEQVDEPNTILGAC